MFLLLRVKDIRRRTHAPLSLGFRPLLRLALAVLLGVAAVAALTGTLAPDNASGQTPPMTATINSDADATPCDGSVAPDAQCGLKIIVTNYTLSAAQFTMDETGIDGAFDDSPITPGTRTISDCPCTYTVPAYTTQRYKLQIRPGKWTVGYYTSHIRVRHGSGTSGKKLAEYKLKLDIPPQPTTVTLGEVTDTTVGLSWATDRKATSAELSWWPKEQRSLSKSASAVDASYTVSDLEPSTAYVIEVQPIRVGLKYETAQVETTTKDPTKRSDELPEISYVKAIVTDDVLDNGNEASLFQISWYDTETCPQSYHAYAGHIWGSQHLGSGLTGIIKKVDKSDLPNGIGFWVTVSCGENEYIMPAWKYYLPVVGIPGTGEIGGTVPGTYTSEPALQSLTFDAGKTTPSFHENRFSYLVEGIPPGTNRVTVSVVTRQGSSAVFVDGHGSVYIDDCSDWGCDYDYHVSTRMAHNTEENRMSVLHDADPIAPGFQIDLIDNEKSFMVHVFSMGYGHLYKVKLVKGVPTTEVSITGGGGINEGGDASFIITANPTPASPIAVKVSVSEDGDFGATGAATVTVSGPTVTYTVTTTDDSNDEADGSVTATLDTPPADAGYTVSATHGAATVAVSDDDDPAPTPGYTVDPEVIAAVEYLASQTHHGTAHVNRWQRALVALGALDPSGVSGGALTLAEARQNANAYSSPVWDQVVAELEAKEAFEAAQQTPPPTPVVSITGASGGTEGEAVTFTVSAHPAPAEDLAVSATVATSGDYGVTAGSRTVTIAADTTSKTLTLQTTDDATDEADGSVTLTLNDGSGYTVSATQGAATASVSDDDPVVSISGGGGVTEGGDASFTITANPAPAADLDVSVTVSQSGDYGAATGQQTVTIPTTGSATLTVSTTNDDADEADGSVTATLDTPPADAGYTVSATQGAATVAVSDDDAPAPTPGYTVDPQVIAAVEYLASQTHHGTAHVNRWQRALVALGALDPAGVSGGALTLAEARQNANAYSSPVWDQVVAELEAKEAFEAAQQTPPPTPEVSITGASGGTEGQAVTFTVSANPAPATDLSVSVTVATVGDYGVTAGPRTVTIAGGTASATLTLQTTDDSTDEADGSVTLTLNDGSGYTLGQVSSETAQVQDDDDASPQPQQQPVVSISGGGGVTEGGNASFTITASPEPASPITVNVTVSASGDYGATTGSRTVTVTTTGSAILTVGTTDDGNDEADGSVTATLVDGADYDLGTNQAATVSVADDDVPVVSISGGGGVTEGGDASFTITASPVPAADLTVNVTVTASGDYGATTGSRTVTVPTTGSAVLTVGTTDDGNDEADGSVTATLVDGAGYDLGTNQAATVSVSDDDDAPPQPQQQPVVSISGGGGVTEGGDASFTITASPEPASPITVNVTVSASGDYGATTGSRTVTVTTTGSAILTVGTTDDGNDEADGSVTATLVDGADYDLGTNQAATVSVADDDVPVVSISGGGGVTEGGDASFTITASPVPAADLTVNVTVTASGDYGATTGSRTVTVPTTGSAVLTVGTTDDGNDEADGSVTATVNAGDGYAVSSSQGAATVIVSDDDDAPPVETAVTISIEDASASENDTDLVFRVTLSEASNEDVTVQWATSHSQSPDRARGGQGYDYDFWHAVGEIVIRAGETSGKGAVWLNQDSKDEPDEVFTVTLSSPKGATLEREEGTMTIIDDD